MFFRNNRIYKIDKNGNKKRIFFVLGLKITFKGKNSTITIKEPFPNFFRCKISCGDNCNISIGTSKFRMKKLRILANGKNSNITIGDNISIRNTCEIVARPENNLSVKIGDDCMFASRILIRATDGHTVKSKATGKTLNYGKPVEIGNHVWIGNDVTILKGSKIPDNSVVAATATVTRAFTEPNAIYAGVPAKLVKTGIDWSREVPGESLV